MNRLILLNRRTKLLVGFLTVWPLIWVLFFIVFAFIFFFLTSDESIFDTYFPIVALFHALTIILSWIILIYYILYLVKTNCVSGDKRVMWILFSYFSRSSHNWFFGSFISGLINGMMASWLYRTERSYPGHVCGASDCLYSHPRLPWPTHLPPPLGRYPPGCTNSLRYVYLSITLLSAMCGVAPSSGR